MNLADIVRINAANRGAHPAILFKDDVYNYRDAWRIIETQAAQLYGAGVRAGDRIGLCLGDHPQHLLAHYAIARLSAVILPIDHRWTPTERAAAAATFGTKLVVSEVGAIDGVPTLELDERARPEALPPIDGSRDQPVLISLSSGTTGKPKGAVVTHENLYERFVSQWTAIGFDSRDCFALLTPLFFGAGRSFGMCLLAAGGSVRIAPPPLKPEEIISVLSDENVSATFLPPTLLRRLLPFAADNAPLLPNLNYLLASGEPLHASEAKECRQKICPNLLSYYASSEGGGISVLAADELAEHAATVGKPTFRTEVEIVDENDRPLTQGSVGRLRYRGPGVAAAFLDGEGKLHNGGADGWFYPGDLAEKLSSGHIALRGRDKDVIIRGGVNIYPAEVEAALQQHGAVEECAVVAVEDADRGQIVAACVVTTEDVADDTLAEFCQRTLAPYKIPSRFARFSELPKRDSGKIDKKALATTLKGQLR